MKIILTPREGIPKYSAIPPQTPDIDLSVADLFSFFAFGFLLLFVQNKQKRNSAICPFKANL